MKKLIIGSIAALGLVSTSAMAQSTWSGGHAGSDRHGSSAGGGSGSEGRHERSRHRDANDDRRAQRSERAPTNSASTYGAGSVYTDRHRATGAVAAGARATGTGSQGASSSIDAYGSTDRNGSTGEVYGDSSATSNPRR